MSSVRRCGRPICDVSLEGRRADALYCGGSCRAAASRERRAARDGFKREGERWTQGALERRTQPHAGAPRPIPESGVEREFGTKVEHEGATIEGPEEQGFGSREEPGGYSETAQDALALTVLMSPESLQALASEIARLLVVELVRQRPRVYEP